MKDIRRYDHPTYNIFVVFLIDAKGRKCILSKNACYEQYKQFSCYEQTCISLYVLILFVDNFEQLAKYDLYKGT